MTEEPPPYQDPGAYEIDEESRNPFVPVEPPDSDDTRPNTAQLPITPIVGHDTIRYRERPHVTLFINGIAGQVSIWLATLAVLSGIAMLSPQIGAIVLIQVAISLGNAYFVGRAYIFWSGYILTVTDKQIIIEQSNSLLFWVRRKPKIVMPLGSIRDYEQLRPTLTELVFFRKRGAVRIQTSSQEDTIFENLRYIKNIDAFMLALK
jgi:hypothetical protein